MENAEALAELVAASGKLFVLTHNYTGYPMVRQARAMVENGDIGDIRVVQLEYPQDWLTEPIELEGQKQAAWRTDPQRSGAGGCIGDIGTHAWNLGAFVTGLQAESLAADLDSFVPGRRLDDNAHILVRYKPMGKAPPAKGMIWASQVAPGNENGLRMRIYGTRGGLEWAQENPNLLRHAPFGEPVRLITRGGAGANAAAAAVTRIPGGHPEGYLEAFATVYTEAAAAIRALRSGHPAPGPMLMPTIQDGLDGMRFIDACIRSSRADGVWVRLNG